MQITTGKAPVNLMAVIAIWALSLSVNLPGLAVSPMLEQLKSIFPTASQLEAQLITILPNLVIIPFVLWSGHMSRSNHKLTIIVTGLLVYIASAVLYFLCNSMLGLILVSCLLGIGCGLFLPFSTGLVADVFTGKYRMHQMGIVSGVGNLAVVIATYVVGWLAAINWHLPFLVYFVPVISLILMPFMSKLPKQDLAAAKATADSQVKAQPVTIPAVDSAGFSTKGQSVKGGFYLGRTIWLCLMYFFWVFVADVITYYMPFLMQQYNMSSQEIGIVTAMFFLSMFVIGVTIPKVLKMLKGWTYVYATIIFGLGCLLFLTSKSVIVFGVASALMGLAQGTSQPIIYDKATEICVRPAGATMALAIILSVNYLGIVMCPFITDFFRDIFGIGHDHALYNAFPFIFDFVAICLLLICCFVRRRGFIFGVSKAYYS